MNIQKSSNFLSNQADIAELRFIMADTTNGFPYALHTSARTSKPFGISTAAAESDNEEMIQYEPLVPGFMYSVTASEAIALGELVACTAAGKAVDADTSTDVVVGVCVKASSADGDILQFVCDANFSSVVA